MTARVGASRPTMFGWPADCLARPATAGDGGCSASLRNLRSIGGKIALARSTQDRDKVCAWHRDRRRHACPTCVADTGTCAARHGLPSADRLTELKERPIMLSRNLEQTLHRALSLASERKHEYATLEHLLLGLTDDTRCGHRAARLRRRSRQAAERPHRISRQGPGRPGDRPAGRPEADRRLPARRAARRHPCAVLRPRRGDRRQRAGGAVQRAREPCRVFPADCRT